MVTENGSESRGVAIREGIALRKRLNRKHSRFPGYGFKWRRLSRVPDPVERRLMTELADRWLEGTSLTTLYFELLGRRVRTRDGREWSRTRIHRTIQAELEFRKHPEAWTNQKPRRMPRKPRSPTAHLAIKGFVRAMSRHMTDNQIRKTMALFIEYFGGAESLAMTFHDTFEATKPGSPTRCRMLACISKMMALAVPIEDAKQRQDLSMFADAELNELMRSELITLLLQHRDLFRGIYETLLAESHEDDPTGGS